jgi:diguanylate cyclase (GGDEF)-like protein
VISIKKYLDADVKAIVEEPKSNNLLTVTLNSYRSALLAIGECAARACPSAGSDLELQLAKLLGRLPSEPTVDQVKRTEVDLEERLDRWATGTAEYLQEKADGVRELLMLLAGTAESLGERDHRYTNQFSGLTAELGAIANLDDLAQVRTSLVRKAAELKICVDQMTQESHDSMRELKSRVTVYESKLKEVEQLALKDSLTGLANRRCAEGRMEWYIAQRQTFCVVIVDLNGFKQINDQYGHAAGDDVLKQFSTELVSNMRVTDLVARWGGDEFIVVLNCELADANAQVERVRKWALGEYTIQSAGKGSVKVHLGGSIGKAEWTAGLTSRQVIEQADAAMYLDKKQGRKKNG